MFYSCGLEITWVSYLAILQGHFRPFVDLLLYLRALLRCTTLRPLMEVDVADDNKIGLIAPYNIKLSSFPFVKYCILYYDVPYICLTQFSFALRN